MFMLRIGIIHVTNSCSGVPYAYIPSLMRLGRNGVSECGPGVGQEGRFWCLKSRIWLV